MKKMIAIIALVVSSQHVFADDCEDVAQLASVGVAAAAAGGGPVTTAVQRTATAMGTFAAYYLTNRTLTELVCDNSTAIELALEDFGNAMACGHGYYEGCELLGVLETSIIRDFSVCGVCTVDEIWGTILMEDNARLAYYENLRLIRGRSPSYSTVIPRNHLQLGPTVLTAYYQGVNQGLQRRIDEMFGSF